MDCRCYNSLNLSISHCLSLRHCSLSSAVTHLFYVAFLVKFSANCILQIVFCGLVVTLTTAKVFIVIGWECPIWNIVLRIRHFDVMYHAHLAVDLTATATSIALSNETSFSTSSFLWIYWSLMPHTWFSLNMNLTVLPKLQYCAIARNSDT